MYLTLNGISFALVIACAMQTYASPVTNPTTGSTSQTLVSQSQSSCISRDGRWTSPCSVARAMRSLTVTRSLRTHIDSLQYYINDTIKRYIADEYFSASWLLPRLELIPVSIFNRNFGGSSVEMMVENSLRSFIANIDVLVNCGAGNLSDINIAIYLDELNRKTYSALCSLYSLRDIQYGNPLPVESMVVQEVHMFITEGNGLAQAINIYQTVNDIVQLLSIIKQHYFL